jgi:hypothetical protein
MMIATALGIAVAMQLQAGAGIPADSIERLRREARRAESEFERLSRQLVPLRFGSAGRDCDEIVGRFCLTYDSGRPPEPDPEHGRVVDARRAAIEALRAAFTWMPGDIETAAPLVRYLVEDDRAAEAVSAARMYELVSGDSIWGRLLTGFAEHAAAQDTSAERLYHEVLPLLPERQRERIEDIQWILEGDDRGEYDRLSDQAAADFRRRFWTLADPLFITPGNESWAEHVSRHVWSQVLARAPVVGDMVRWGEDLEQLTVRYGVPVGRTRTPGSITQDGTLVEHYDPDQLVFAPPDLLSRGLPPIPLPGRPWELDRVRGRSGFAPVTIRRVIAIDHQVSRFPKPEGTLLRIDGQMVMDSVAGKNGHLETGLWVLDGDLRVLQARRGSAQIQSGTASFALEVEVPGDGPFLYSIEALESSSRLAGRARYATDSDSTDGALKLSDPLITFPFGSANLPASLRDPAIRPRPVLVLASTDTLGLYAEARGLSPGQRYQVTIAMEKASRASLPSRVVSWLGNRFGLGSSTPATRSEWVAVADASGAATIAFELRPSSEPNGDYVVKLEITDLSTTQSVASQRIVRFGNRVTKLSR